MKHACIHSAALVTILFLNKKCLPYISPESALYKLKNAILCPIAVGLINKSIPKDACVLVNMLNLILFPYFPLLCKSRLSILIATYHFYSVESCPFKYFWLDEVKIED